MEFFYVQNQVMVKMEKTGRKEHKKMVKMVKMMVRVVKVAKMVKMVKMPKMEKMPKMVKMEKIAKIIRMAKRRQKNNAEFTNVPNLNIDFKKTKKIHGIVCRGQFHLHFTRGFFVRKFCTKLFCA
jgi:hypothetical protein